MATHETFRRYTRRDRTSASDQNALRQAVENLQRGGGVDARRMQGVLVPQQQHEPFFFIVLDGSSDHSALPKYTSWHEVDLAEDGSVVQLADTLVGSTALPAYSESGYDAPPSGIPYLARMSMQETAVLFWAYPFAAVGPTPGDESNCWPAYDAALDADQNDYDPSLLLWWRLTRGTTPANVNITGIAAGGDGCPILITHEGKTGGGITANTITLKGTSTASLSSNRILDPNGLASDVVLTEGRSVVLRYDLHSSRWLILGYPDASLTQVGIVSLSAQSMGAGAKYFSDKVGIGTASPLANSALDVRGYTYTYLAGIISFGGGNSPTSEANGAILQYAKGVSPQISMTIASADYGSGKGGGFLVDGNNARFSFRHNGATTPKFSFYNDATSTYTDGSTNTFTLAKLTPAGTNGSVTVTGGLVTSITPPT